MNTSLSLDCSQRRRDRLSYSKDPVERGDNVIGSQAAHKSGTESRSGRQGTTAKSDIRVKTVKDSPLSVSSHRIMSPDASPPAWCQPARRLPESCR